jgi:hypothetical protein
MKLQNVATDLAKLKLEMVDEYKGTCVLSGIIYSDLKSILTEADLYIYEDRRKTEEELKAIDPKDRYAKNKLATKVEALEYLEEKQHLIKRLEELVTHSITLTHNPKAKLKAYEPPQEEYFHLHTKLIAEDKMQEIEGTTPIIPPPKEYKEHYCRVCDGNGNNPVWKCEMIGCGREYEALCYEHFE